ncbi:SIMPL domain-containing protein [Paracoccus sp. 1_MG-2023]|uniref:SIMPL domain-containing protein n=1 Tax=unclassified Paracoccus (in: a-proteobacteria) TaxID=2688777 RepID=UPI001C09DDFA|nr:MULTISPECIES: SIMPL domain-containing protein [unclassified Paracoccus (in: a-proteobacteria)]MBU2956700.1 SIMPL domain-containing protein [Paracoccus sp. C2R09]MDO6669260.1 SIMPL domain-containing protein [Paracoccus sp. 1_MG-2023]
MQARTTIRRMAMGAVLTGIWALPAMAQQGGAMSCGADHGPSRLQVSGSGQARVAPDMAVISLGVTTQGDSADAAMSDNSTRQQAVIDALRDAGIEQSQIQTSGLNLRPMMQYDEGQPPKVTGYEARNMVTIRATDLARLGEVLDAIVGAGANQIDGIAFERQDGDAGLDEARTAAVQDARRKAELLAEAAGAQLGPILSMSESSGGRAPQPMMRMEAAMADSVPVQAGEVELSAEVRIEYALTGDAACSMGRQKGGDGRPKARPDRQVTPPLPDEGAPEPDEPLSPGIVEPLPETE